MSERPAKDSAIATEITHVSTHVSMNKSSRGDQLAACAHKMTAPKGRETDRRRVGELGREALGVR